jgi:DHA2 family metal-tetracycline-proton antiporter-like MFS transporter
VSPPDKSGTKEASSGGSTRLLLAVLISAVFVSVLNSSMVNVVVPSIQEEFGASEGQVGWIITGYLLVYAVGIPLYGRVSDLFSLRWTFCLGLLVFAAGSLFCALAPNLLLLVLGRIVQAAGGAAIPALATASVAKVLAPGDRGTALGLIFSSVGIGAAVGPILGGVVETVAGWQTLFLGTLLLALIVLPIAFRELPHTERSDDRSFDLPGGVLLALAAGLFLFGITQGEVAGFDSASSWGSFVGSALAAAGFTRRITTAPHPFVSPSLFRNTGFVAAVAVGFFSMLANVSCLVIIPLLISTVNELPSSAAALALTPGAIALAILSPFAGRLSDRVGMRPLIFAGLAVMLLSALFLSTFAAGASPIVVSAGMLGVGAGFAFANSPTTNAAAAALPQAEAGVGLGIYQGLFFLGGGTGPAVVGTFLAARREAGADALNPLYALDAASFSDAFLIIAVALVLAFAASLKVQENGKQPPDKAGRIEAVPAAETESRTGDEDGQPASWADPPDAAKRGRGGTVEADALTLTIEQEVLRWPGVTATPGRFGATAFRYGDREIGHLHRRDRIVDLPVTPEIREELLARDRATPQLGGVEGYVSYPILDREDVSVVLEILGWNYDRARDAASQEELEAET